MNMRQVTSNGARAFVLVVAVFAFLTSRSSAEEPHAFELKANTAAKSLKQFARQARLSIIFKPSTVRDIRTNEVRGLMLPEDALTQLLDNTLLDFRRSGGSGGLVVFRQEKMEAVSGTDIARIDEYPPGDKFPKKSFIGHIANLLVAPGEGKPHRGADPEFDKITLSPFVVEADDSSTYNASNAHSATRMYVPLKYVPFNLQVITNAFIDDTMSFGGEPLPFGGGANREATSWIGAVEGKSVRGFNTREYLRNGFLRYSDNGSATIDRIEVIKGPTSVLDGITSPGGVINVITKTPDPHQDFSRFKIVLGAPLNRIVANFDINRRLNGKTDHFPKFTFRLAAGYEKSHYLSRYRKRELENIMPSLYVELSENTFIGIQHEYYYVNGERGNEIYGFFNTVPVEHPNGLDGEVPLSDHYGIDRFMSWDGPDFSTPERVNDSLVSFQHSFAKNFVFKIDYSYHKRRVNWGPYSVRREVNETNGVPYWSHEWAQNDRSQSVEGLRVNAAYTAQTSNAEHRFVAGYVKQDDSTISAPEDFANEDGTLLRSRFPLLDPAPDLRAPSPPALSRRPRSDRNVGTDSLYLNHHARWFNGKLTTLWGIYNANLDTTRLQTQRDPLVPALDPIFYKASKAMPQAGIVYALNNFIGLYANYSESMQGNAGVLDGFDDPFPETPGEIREIGSKFETEGGKISGIVSLFEIKESNRIVWDPLAPNKDNPSADPSLERGANVSIDELTSKGFDADLFFYPIKNFNTVLSYGYKSMEVSADEDPNWVGRSQNIYKHKISLFNKYTWSEGPLAGVSANAGLTWRSKQQRHHDRFGAPAYEDPRLGLQVGVGYQWKSERASYQVRLAAKNLGKFTKLSSGYIPGTRDAYYQELPAEYLLSFDMGY